MIYGFMVLLFLPFTSVASEGSGESVSIEFEEVEEDESGNIYGVEKIFRNKAIASGLEKGVDNLNRSIDSLMEAIFYSLMDNELKIDISDSANFSADLKRDVYTSTDGSYVVVDTFSVGPNLGSNLTSIEGLPLGFGAGGDINVLNISLRTDGQRVAEGEDLPWFRAAANNWFGLLPLLIKLLPPSFNPNELYDPIGQVQTPFSFPFTIEQAETMPIGNLRSYSVTGVVHIGLDFLFKKIESGSELFDTSIDMTFPYTIFKNSEHRINVLRRSSKVFWVGLSSSNKLGHRVGLSLLKAYSVFNRVSPLWSGIPAVILPIDVEESASQVFNYDMVFEFDTSFPEALLAYEKAVMGDFSLSERLYLQKRDFQIENGVRFLFRRRSEGAEYNDKYARNYIVQKKSNQSYSGTSNIVTWDPSGKFEVLEGRKQWEIEDFDVIVGSNVTTFENRSTVRVTRTNDEYIFDDSSDSPYDVTIGLNIQDKYVDAFEFRKYMENLKMFTNLDLHPFDQVNIRDEQRLTEFRERASLSDPMLDIDELYVTPTTLGEIAVDAAIYLSRESIDSLVSMKDRDLLEGFIKGYKLDKFVTVDQFEQGSPRVWGGRVGSFLLFPMKFANFRLLEVDAINEVSDRIDAIRFLRESDGPEDFVEGLQRLSDTEYPLNLAASLNLLLGDRLPRSLSFSTKKKGRPASKAKETFALLDKKVFRSIGAMPATTRYQYIREQLSKFNHREMKENRRKPQIRHLRLSREKGSTLGFDLLLLVEVTHLGDYDSVRAFLKLEQAGKVNVGRFLLTEQVLMIPLQSWKNVGGERRAIYSIRIAPDEVGFDSFVLKQAMSLGGSFKAYLSVSADGSLWSEEKEILFRYENNMLLPSKKS